MKAELRKARIVALIAVFLGSNGNSHGQLFVDQIISENVVAGYNAATGHQFMSITSGLNTPKGLAITNNALYIANWGNSTIGEYDATTGAAINSNFITMPPNSYPAGLALAGNNLYIIYQGTTGTVGEYDATTGATINANFITGLSSPNQLAISGNILYVTNYAANTVGEYNATSGSAINSSFITGLHNPSGLAVSDNTLYVANHFGNNIGEYDATTGTAINANFIAGLNTPDDLAVSGNDLYVVIPGSSGSVGEYDATSGAPLNTSFIGGLSGPINVAVPTVPEPGSAALLSVGIVGICALQRRRS